MLAISVAAMLDLIQRVQIFLIVRLHGHCPADMLQRRNLITQRIIGQGAEIIPAGVALGAVLQGIQRFAVAAKANVLVGGLLVIVAGGLAAVAAVAAVTTLRTVTSGGLGFFGVLDLFVGGVDLLHLLGGSGIAGVAVRVVLLGKSPVGPLYFIVRGVGADTKDLIGIVNH